MSDVTRQLMTDRVGLTDAEFLDRWRRLRERGIGETEKVSGDDLIRLLDIINKLLPFVIQKCPECGVVLGPDAPTPDPNEGDDFSV